MLHRVVEGLLNHAEERQRDFPWKGSWNVRVRKIHLCSAVFRNFSAKTFHGYHQAEVVKNCGMELVGQGLNISGQLEQIWQQCSSLTGDVQALSHELHPSILDNLGLVTAAKSFCRELSEEGEMNVVFTHESVPASLSREVSLSLFRVIQEAVHNAAKYSGERHFKVHLQGKPGEIELEVVDHGVGFDVESAKAAGLGLVSMAERINVLSGTFTIDSKPNFGTRICASVPLPAEAKVMAATAT